MARQSSARLVHINFGPGPVVEVKRKPLGERWCFGCRKRRDYEFVIYRYDCDPLEDYYGPWGSYECTACRKDRLLFPGYERTWEDS